MCTVSFYRKNNQIIITSNRDENINRPIAFPPNCEFFNEKKLFFPKDPKAGGSWFVVNELKNVFVLLNGAESFHVSNPPYRLSRGKILLEIAASSNIQKIWNNINLNNIEPFTIVAFVDSHLYQLRWNGINKTEQEIKECKFKIWSSTTLYEPEIIEKREQWFNGFIFEKNEKITANDLFQFHTQTQKKDSINGLVINRNEEILTKNVTQVILQDDYFELSHYDLILKTKTILTEL